MYIWAIDISLSSTGVAIFENDQPLFVFSIPTASKLEQRKRLKIIGDTLLEYKKLYPTNLVILEAGFGRFQISTQTLFKVHGIVNYLFADCEQIYFAPSTIKKVVGGNGRADKEEIKKIVMLKYPHLSFANNDESDSVSIMLCYLASKGKETKK